MGIGGGMGNAVLLKSGANETREFKFHSEDVRIYCSVIGKEYDGTVPPLKLYFLNLKCFQIFKGEAIRLVRTNVEMFENLESDIQYYAYLTHKNLKK